MGFLCVYGEVRRSKDELYSVYPPARLYNEKQSSDNTRCIRYKAKNLPSAYRDQQVKFLRRNRGTDRIWLQGSLCFSLSVILFPGWNGIIFQHGLKIQYDKLITSRNPNKVCFTSSVVWNWWVSMLEEKWWCIDFTSDSLCIMKRKLHFGKAQLWKVVLEL